MQSLSSLFQSPTSVSPLASSSQLAPSLKNGRRRCMKKSNTCKKPTFGSGGRGFSSLYTMASLLHSETVRTRLTYIFIKFCIFHEVAGTYFCFRQEIMYNFPSVIQFYCFESRKLMWIWILEFPKWQRLKIVPEWVYLPLRPSGKCERGNSSKDTEISLKKFSTRELYFKMFPLYQLIKMKLKYGIFQNDVIGFDLFALRCAPWNYFRKAWCVKWRCDCRSHANYLPSTLQREW